MWDAGSLNFKPSIIDFDLELKKHKALIKVRSCLKFYKLLGINWNKKSSLNRKVPTIRRRYDIQNLLKKWDVTLKKGPRFNRNYLGRSGIKKRLI